MKSVFRCGLPLFALLTLSACGVETATTAAATAAAKAQEVKAGKELEEKMRTQIDQATQLNLQQLKAAAEASQ